MQFFNFIVYAQKLFELCIRTKRRKMAEIMHKTVYKWGFMKGQGEKVKKAGRKEIFNG